MRLKHLISLKFFSLPSVVPVLLALLALSCDTTQPSLQAPSSATIPKTQLYGRFTLSVQIVDGAANVTIRPADGTYRAIPSLSTPNYVTVSNVSNAYNAGSNSVSAVVRVTSTSAYYIGAPLYFQLITLTNPGVPDGGTEYDTVNHPGGVNTNVEQSLITGVDNGGAFVGDAWNLNNKIGVDQLLTPGEMSSTFQMTFNLIPGVSNFNATFDVLGLATDGNQPVTAPPAPVVTAILTQQGGNPAGDPTSDSEVYLEGTVTFPGGTTLTATDYQMVFRDGSSAVIGAQTISANANVLSFGVYASLSLNQQNTISLLVRYQSGSGADTKVSLSPVTTVSLSHDDGPPTLTSIFPANGSGNVATTIALTATFNEALDPATVTTANVTMNGGVTGTVLLTNSNRTIQFTPSSALASGTSYTWSISSAVKGADGQSISAVQTSFTTATAGNEDQVAPQLLSFVPGNGQPNVPVTTQVRVTFNEALAIGSVPTHFFLEAVISGIPVSGTVSFENANKTIVFTPSVDLAWGTDYRVRVTTGITDSAGNPLAAEQSSLFTTDLDGIIEEIPPVVEAVVPVNGEANVPVGTPVYVTFSEEMSPNSIDPSTILLRDMGTNNTVAATVTLNGNQALLSPLSALANNTTYRVEVTTTVADLVGNRMLSPFTSTFTTTAALDTTRPVVVSMTPTDGASGVSNYADVYVIMSERVDPATVTTATVYVRQYLQNSGSACYGSNNVPGSVTLLTDGKTIRWSPNAKPLNDTYGGPSNNCEPGKAPRWRMFVENIADLSGNTLSTTFNSYWISNADNTSPWVSAVSPSNGATAVDPNSNIVIAFSETIDAATVTNTVGSGTVRLLDGGADVTTSLQLSVDGRTLTINPSAALVQGTTYQIVISAGLKDLAGNALTTMLGVAMPSSFTVGAADTTAPAVESITVEILKNGAPVPAAWAKITFSEVIDPLSINSENFILYDGTTPIPSLLTSTTAAGKTTVFLNPLGLLTKNATYTVHVSGNVRDLAWNLLGTSVQQNLTVSNSNDTKRPKTSSSSPNLQIASRSSHLQDPSTTVSTSTTAFNITFNEAIDPETLASNIMFLRKTCPGVNNCSYTEITQAVTVSSDWRTITITPAEQPLPSNYVFAITVSENVGDTFGNAFQAATGFTLLGVTTQFFVFKTN